MNANDLKRLGKKELMELLLEQTKRADALEEELNIANEKLADRTIKLNKAGDIAQAALALNDVFFVAQTTADEYLVNVKRMAGETDLLCQAMLSEAKSKSDAMVAEATEKSDAMVADAQMLSDTIMKRAKEEAQGYWNEVKIKLDAYYDAHQGLRELLGYLK